MYSFRCSLCDKLLDALYATNSNFSLLEELNMGYSIVRKAKVLKTVGADCEGLKKTKEFPQKINIKKESKRFNIQQEIYFFNNIPYREHSLSIIQLDEHADKRPSKRFAKIQSKQTHWEWIVHKILTKENVGTIASKSRLRWREEDLFNTLQCRDFAIEHDFNRAFTSQSVRIYLILIAYALTSIFTYSTIGQKLLSQRFTISFLMDQMLRDLIYLPYELLFLNSYPKQLRFSIWSGAS